VGAGDGTLVAAFRLRGRDALGLEREASGRHVRSGEVGDVAGEWAAVVFWHSLEHLRDPAKALSDAAARLKPGGVLVVAVPNYGSLQARVFGERWFALDLPRHLVHLDGRLLARRIGDLGLKVVQRSDLLGGQVFFGWLDGLVGSLPWGLDLYASIRRPAARGKGITRGRRVATLISALVLAPVALVATGVEVVLGRGGTVYLMARR
jgi:SAM-dependent methyltransferase